MTISHRFRVKAYKDEVFQWEWTTGLNTVSGTWQYSHFWPQLVTAEQGKWRFDLFFIPEIGSEMGAPAFVASTNFRVFSEGTLTEGGGGGDPITFPDDTYYYNWNGYTCPGPIEGGQDTNWVYTCGIPRTTFEQGETVNALVRIDDPMSNFRFGVDVYKDGVYQWDYTGTWNDVGPWGWSWAYFPITMQAAQPGDWQFLVYVDEGEGFELIDTLNFSVSSADTPYQYSGDLVICRGPVTGGAETNWLYTCQNPTSTFNLYDPGIAMIRIDNVNANFRWKTDFYANGVLQWSETTNWNDVGEWGWDKSQYWPTTGSLWLAGSWEYKIYIDTGNGFQHLDSAFFTIN